MYQMDPLRYFEEYIKKINDELERELEFYSWSQFYEPLKYACKNGKRIRPLILILAAESIGSYDDKIYLAASAVELLHTESIIHDDIIDDERFRRGDITFHKKYGYNFSVLTADFVLGIILNIIAKINNKRVAKELSKAALMMSEGEALELRLNNTEFIKLEDYIKIVKYKTASLFNAATKIGAILANGNELEIEALSKFGKYIGIAYQIRDDLNDWSNEKRAFNILLDSYKDKREFLSNMYKLYINYINKAEKSLSIINNKTQLEKLIELTLDGFKINGDIYEK